MNDQIPPNPHPVKPPADLPPPRKESLQDEVKRLKSEVEHLGAFRTHTIIPNEILKAENARLKAENERLRKAGDAMEDAIIDGGLNALNNARDTWTAAREGKQP